MTRLSGYPQPTNKKSVAKMIMLTIAIVAFTGVAALAGYFYWRYESLQSSPATIAQEKTQQLADKLKKIYAVPDETPTIAEINDKGKLKDQPYFKGAENGDHLFIFPKHKLAILYRESTNQLVNVGPIAISSQSSKNKTTN